jgi:hypothetical protein
VIEITGTYCDVAASLAALRRSGIPFIDYRRVGSRAIVEDFEKYASLASWTVEVRYTIRERDFDLARLACTATTRISEPWPIE